MNETERNMPVEAIQEVNSSREMRNLRARQAVTTWGLRGIALFAALQVSDKVQENIFSGSFPFDDLRVFAIAAVSSTLFVGSRYIGSRFEKQKDAMRANATNRKIKTRNPFYSPDELPEGHIEQYRGDPERAMNVARRLNDLTKKK